MPKNRSYNPLVCIPPAQAVEESLRKAQERVRQLKILLKTARAIERSQPGRQESQRVS
jgi:hypothetical protein